MGWDMCSPQYFVQVFFKAHELEICRLMIGNKHFLKIEQYLLGGGGKHGQMTCVLTLLKNLLLYILRGSQRFFDSWCDVDVHYDFTIFVYILEANISDRSSEFQYYLDYGSFTCISIELFELAYHWDKSFSMCNNIINDYIFIKFIIFISNHYY